MPPLQWGLPWPVSHGSIFFFLIPLTMQYLILSCSLSVSPESLPHIDRNWPAMFVNLTILFRTHLDHTVDTQILVGCWRKQIHMLIIDARKYRVTGRALSGLVTEKLEEEVTFRPRQMLLEIGCARAPRQTRFLSWRGWEEAMWA